MMVASFESVARFVWTRHRQLLLITAAIYLALFLCSQTLTPEQMRPYLPPAFSILRLAPFFLPIVLFISTASVTTLDIGGRPGQFPRIFFTLPVKAHEMVLPFITYSVATAAVLWLLGTLITDRRILMFGVPGTPIEAETIAYWLPCLATGFLAWIQAIIWTPFRLRWLRFAAIFAILLAHLAVAVLYAMTVITQAEVIAIGVLQIPLALFFATRGVARDRSGEAGVAEQASDPAKTHALQTFSSALDAQLWFEGRLHRWKGVFVFSPPVLLFLLFVGADVTGTDTTHPMVFTGIARLIVLMFTWFLLAMATIIGITFASYQKQASWQKKGAFAMPAFFAALPLSTGDFVWAKITTAMTRVLWLSVITLLACGWVVVRAGMLDGSSVALRQVHGDFIAMTVLLIPLAACVLFLLAGTANLMCLSLEGRFWGRTNLIHFSRYLLLAIAAAAVGRYWAQNHVPPPGLGDAIRILAVAKIAGFALIVYHVGTRGLLSWNRLATIGLFWLATVGSMLATAVWLLPADRLSLLTGLASLLLAAPVLGTASSPLALQLNRTR